MTAAKCKSCKRELRCSCGALVKEKDGWFRRLFNG